MLGSRLQVGKCSFHRMLLSCYNLIHMQGQPTAAREEGGSAISPPVCRSQIAAATCSTYSADLASPQHAFRDLFLQKGLEGSL